MGGKGSSPLSCWHWRRGKANAERWSVPPAEMTSKFGTKWNHYSPPLLEPTVYRKLVQQSHRQRERSLPSRTRCFAARSKACCLINTRSSVLSDVAEWGPCTWRESAHWIASSRSKFSDQISRSP